MSPRMKSEAPKLHLPSPPWFSFLSMAVIFLFTAAVLIFCLLCRGEITAVSSPSAPDPTLG